MGSVGVDGAASTGFGVLDMDRGVGGRHGHGASVFLCRDPRWKILIALQREDSSAATKDIIWVTVVRHPGRTDEIIDGQTS